MADFATLLRRHRVAAGLSQDVLAERASLSRDAVSTLERGVRRAPYRETTVLLADALGIQGAAREEFESAAQVARRRAPRPDSSASARSDRVSPNNLPAELSSFVGRENIIAEVEHLIRSHRLVTLVGIGGVGKTRIALRVATELLDSTPDGAWFVDFAPIGDASLVPGAIASALDVRESPNVPFLESIAGYLTNRDLLLVLDNCEHLIEEVTRAAETLLRRCSRVRILATSRELLGVAGERTYRVPSMSVPALDTRGTFDVENALEYDGVALFVDRAMSADSCFALTEQNVPTVVEICRRLDGVALAIELAAARISVLSATALAARLNERFLVLTGGSRTALPRHKTMRALLDWSYDLLSEREQWLLRRLSIFAGGFTLELATAISEVDVLDWLTSLVNKSLVQSDVSPETTRYRLLESTRQYAREKLDQHGEYAEVARAHATALLALAERFDLRLELVPDVLWDAQIPPELDNWRAGLDWAFGSSGDLRVGQRLAGSLGSIWQECSLPIEGLRWLRTSMETCDDGTPPEVQARLEFAGANLEALSRQFKQSLASSERALLYCQMTNDPIRIAEAQVQVAVAAIFMHDVARGESLVHAALPLFRRRGATRLSARALYMLAIANSIDGNVDAALGLYREVLALLKAARSEANAGVVANAVAVAEFAAGHVDAALQAGLDAVEILRAHNKRYYLATSLSDCSAYLIALARYEEARDYARKALARGRDAPEIVARVLQHLAAIVTFGDDSSSRSNARLQIAARVFGFVNAHYVKYESKRNYTEQQEYDKMLPVLRSELGANLDALMNEGAEWTEVQAVAEAVRISDSFDFLRSGPLAQDAWRSSRPL